MIQRILHTGKTWPLYLFLLPVFFIFHAWAAYGALLDKQVCLLAFLIILGGTVVLFLLCKLVFRKNDKAALITATLGITFLFFGDIQNLFRHFPLIGFMGKYKVFVPLLVLLTGIIVYRVYRSKQLREATLFLNILLLIYLLIDASTLLRPDINTGIEKTKLEHSSPKTSSPDIYYVLLDCYPSPGYQKEMLGMDDGAYLDSFLTEKSFYVVRDARSNYANTAFSMASTLGLNYLTHIDTQLRMSAPYYNRAMSIVDHSPLFTLLDEQGYRLYNYSIFDIQGQPAMKKDAFLSAGTEQLLFFNTAWECFKRDALWQIAGNKQRPRNEKINAAKKFFDPQKKYNQRLTDTLLHFDPSTRRSPFFLYAHLEMPHFPYFYDSSGREYPDEEIYGDDLIANREKFSGYIRYANQKAAAILSHLLEQTRGQAIIVVQSDHCIADLDWSRKADAFRNFSAFYFPDKEYSSLYSGMSNVNTFRIILNKYFGQQLPLLADKSYFTR